MKSRRVDFLQKKTHWHKKLKKKKKMKMETQHLVKKRPWSFCPYDSFGSKVEMWVNLPNGYIMISRKGWCKANMFFSETAEHDVESVEDPFFTSLA